MHLHAGVANGGLCEWHLNAVAYCSVLYKGLPDLTNGLSRTRGARIAAILLVSATVAAAQPDPLAGLDDYIARAMTTFQVPGIAVAVVKDDRVVLAKGYGIRKLGEINKPRSRIAYKQGRRNDNCKCENERHKKRSSLQASQRHEVIHRRHNQWKQKKAQLRKS
jgi:hypothetical protein